MKARRNQTAYEYFFSLVNVHRDEAEEKQLLFQALRYEYENKRGIDKRGVDDNPEWQIDREPTGTGKPARQAFKGLESIFKTRAFETRNLSEPLNGAIETTNEEPINGDVETLVEIPLSPKAKKPKKATQERERHFQNLLKEEFGAITEGLRLNNYDRKTTAKALWMSQTDLLRRISFLSARGYSFDVPSDFVTGTGLLRLEKNAGASYVFLCKHVLILG